MPSCQACGSSIANNVRFCSNCGSNLATGSDAPTISVAPVAVNEDATIDIATTPSPKPARQASASPSRISSSAEYLLNEGRFLPGRLLAGRYRIIALLGKGGMGEVYRADDLTLGQTIALKFLPDEAAQDEALLERFRNEVRIARRVSHPNVCRVYDVGSVEGQTYFTMEYIDGEDLASLLRRIGRLPQDKALDIARQLCAGLAAAHAKGVLHRDLKPANIMLDGRGQAVITDFGLAGIADQIKGADVRSGTPAYMAPEQLSGKEVTVRSDTYSLGLVLYEIFTGKRPFGEKSSTAGKKADRTLSRPSAVVKDLDPLIERVILRCLEEEPSARPASVLTVAAALPGGDPLAAALAAGETPSPQMVAAAGETAGLRPRVAVACFGAVLLAAVLAVGLGIHYSGLSRMHLDLTPEVLAHKARETVAQLGYPERPVDSAYGLDYDGDFLDAVEKGDKPRPDWNAVLAGRPTPVQFWYRESPDTMAAKNFQDQMMNPGIVTLTDPPPVLSGMIGVMLDSQGKLTYFQAIPPQKDTSATSATTFDWNVLFGAAGLDPSQFQKAEPMWNSLASSDTRAAWTGMWPGTSRPLRIEAAAYRGKPVFFYLVGDWVKPGRMKAAESFSDHASQYIGITVLTCLMIGAAYLARRNYRQGRADREGAFRLAAVMFALKILIWLCSMHFTASLGTFGMLILDLATAVFIASVIWILYLALEPWVRRRWPQALISWSRLISGQVRDPLVGRDILFGVMLGLTWILLFQLRYIPMMRLGAVPGLGSSEFLEGGRSALASWLGRIPGSIFSTLVFFFLLLVLKVILRKDWLAAIAFVAIYALPRGLTSTYVAADLPSQIVIYGVAVLIVYRFGLVPLAVAIFTANLLGSVPISSELTAWYTSSTLWALLSVVAIAGWGFYHSLGGDAVWQVDIE